MEIAGEDNTQESPHVGEDKIFVALGNVLEENTSTLLWALKNFRGKNLCILHVHQPSQEIRVMGVKFRAAALNAHQVKAHREKEMKEMRNTLNEYLDICVHAGVRAETINIEMDNIEKGIVDLIAQHGIIKLVMGAASNKHYSKNLEKLESKKAIFVCNKAPISCHIWFVCKGHLIVTREGISKKTAIKSPSALDSPIGITQQLNQSRNIHISKSFSYDGLNYPVQNNMVRRAISAKTDTNGGFKPFDRQASKVVAKSESVRLTNPVQDLFRRAMSRRSESSTGRENPSSSRSQIPRSHFESSDHSWQLSIDSSEPNSRDETSDDETMVSSTYDSSPGNELLQETNRYMQELEIAGSDGMVTDLVEKKVLSVAQQLVAMKKEVDELHKLKKIREEQLESLQRTQFFLVFSALDIESATRCFNPSMMIGEGAFGKVYKGVLRQTPVAIKKFHFHSLEEQSSSDFQREIDVLSKVRHPNLVTLIGACPEASSLVFEYLANGSLEDRLACKDGTPPLSWKTRICIAKEICSALIFLHANQPDSIVHGDLKPSNILLDINFVSKLGDFGIASFIPRDEDSIYTTTISCVTDPKGTIAYMDPHFLITGELTPKADVYSFGVVLLQLLTGKPAMWLPKKVQTALDKGTLNAMLDASAGDWPMVKAKQLAQMALRCCELNRKNRPKLESEVWKLLLLLENQI